MRIVGLKLLHGKPPPVLPAPTFDRRLMPKGTWSRCIHITRGSVVFASCTVACASGVGLLVEATGTRVRGVQTRFSHSGADGVAVLGGAEFEAEACEFGRNGASGVYVRGSVSRARLSGCRLVCNKWQGANVLAGGYIHVFNSWILGNAQAGLSAFEQGSVVRVVNSDLLNNLHGIAAEDEARAVVSRCRLLSNKEAGVFCQTPGASVWLDTCQIEGNLLGVAVRDRGKIAVDRCIVKANRVRNTFREKGHEGGILEGAKEGETVTELVYADGWEQMMDQRRDREVARGMRRRRRRQVRALDLGSPALGLS